MADEISLDLEELRRLQSIAKRPFVVSLISSKIQSLEKLKENASSTVLPPTSTQLPAIHYTTLSSFSWDQDIEKVKIYLSLEGVQEEKVEKSFNSMSVELKLHDVQGKNYKFVIPKLNKDIVPDKCKLIVKPKRVTIVLVKASKATWLDLHYKEEKVKPQMDETKDPMAGIMSLMKNMYEEGDDELKKTIAKAWTEARSGKANDPLKGYR